MNKDNQNQAKPKLTKDALRSALSLFAYIKPYWSYFIGAMILLVIGSILMLAIMGIPGEMVSVATGSGLGKFSLTLNQWGLVMFALLAIRAASSFAQTILFANVSERGVGDVRRDVYKRLITQDLNFFESSRVGELTSRITADVEQLQSVFSITLAEFIRQILILIFGIAVLAFLMPRLFLIMLLVIPGVVVAAMFFGRYIRKLSRQRQDQLALTNTIVEETFQNFSIVKAFANELFEFKRYGASIDKMISISLRFAWIRGVFFAFVIFLLFGSILFILWRGALLVQQGEMDAGNLLSFVIYTVMIGAAIASLGNLYTSILGALGATERIQEILNRSSELEMDSTDEDENRRILGKLALENVSFSYPSRHEIEVLNDVSMTIHQGEKVALIGQSGSGKSTLIKLLINFYPVEVGIIKIDDVPIVEYDLRSLRRQIGIVPQEVILFGGTIRENLIYGRPDATEEEIQTALEQSNSHEFVSRFPEGLETIVGERGIKLSGGQKQRIAIARTILKNPAILLLDEATSSLDAESERLVQEALDRLMVGRTSIIIAHRLSTIRDVDRIYVLDKGRIVEQGSHDALLSKEGGVYKSMARLQFDIHQ